MPAGSRSRTSADCSARRPCLRFSAGRTRRAGSLVYTRQRCVVCWPGYRDSRNRWAGRASSSSPSSTRRSCRFREVCDALIVLLTVQHPERMVFYALITTIGSVAGCYSLYLVGRKGGESFLRKRFHARHVDRALDVFRRHGILSILVPSLLPPPMPFKIFVLAAGVSGMRPVRLPDRGRRSGGRRATSASGCWRCGRGSRRWSGLKTTPARRASCSGRPS